MWELPRGPYQLLLVALCIVHCYAEIEPVEVEEKDARGPTHKPMYGDFRAPFPSLDKYFNAGDRVGFIHALVASLSVIIVSELGDKTFFIAAIMAMKHPRLTVFMGAMVALGLMTVLSAFLGFATTIIPRTYTYYISTALFALFGLKMLKEGYYMSPNEGQDEFEEVNTDLRKRDDEIEKELLASDLESGRTSNRRRLFNFISRIFIQAFTLTFLAEWGDRSQITTIILAAKEDVLGVAIGGTMGHAICTAIAVIGGRIVAQKISVRTVTLIGGVVFLIFAVSALFFDPNS